MGWHEISALISEPDQQSAPGSWRGGGRDINEEEEIVSVVIEGIKGQCEFGGEYGTYRDCVLNAPNPMRYFHLAR